MNRTVLLDAVARVLRPIVRLMIRNGEPSEVLEELVRQTYVGVAEQEFDLPHRKQSASRISLLTGLHRREVARLREQLAARGGAEIAGYNRVEGIVAAWLREPDYLTKRGEPRVLKFTGDGSFSELVERHGRDVTPRAVVDELSRTGTVELTDSGSVRLLTRGYLPGSNSEQQLAVYGYHAADFLNTLDHNVSTRQPEQRLFQRQVIYNRIAPQHLPAFARYSGQLGQRVLEQLDAWLQKRTAAEDEPAVRIGLGIYQIRSPSHKDDTD